MDAKMEALRRKGLENGALPRAMPPPSFRIHLKETNCGASIKGITFECLFPGIKKKKEKEEEKNLRPAATAASIS